MHWIPERDWLAQQSHTLGRVIHVLDREEVDYGLAIALLYEEGWNRVAGCLERAQDLQTEDPGAAEELRQSARRMIEKALVGIRAAAAAIG